MRSFLYMAVDLKYYELPYCIADSIVELAEKLGVTALSIRSEICHAKKENRKCKYVKVYLGEEYGVPGGSGRKKIVFKSTSPVEITCIKEDGTKTVYPNLKTASKELKIPEKEIREYCLDGYGAGCYWILPDEFPGCENFGLSS